MPAPTTPANITQLWNAAYPTMRTIATTRITYTRQQIRDEAWKVDADSPHAAALRVYTRTETDLRRRLARLEELRRTLHQLDRGTHRACTRSDGGFNELAAYRAVRGLLDVTGLNDRGLSVVYELAAGLAVAADEWRRLLAALTA